MLSSETAIASLEAAAAELKGLSYEELEKFARSQGAPHDWQSRELVVGGEKVYLNTLFGKLGRIHKRISVELTLSAQPGILPTNTPCLYFERYESGRLYPSPRQQAMEARMLKALPYALVAVAVSGLLALAWYLFVRSK